MTLVLELPTELEQEFQAAAQKQGKSVEEFMIGAARFAATNGDEKEAARLAAIERLHGMGRGFKFGSEAIRRDRNEDLERDERDFQQHFKQRP